jgi:endonuclease III
LPRRTSTRKSRPSPSSAGKRSRVLGLVDRLRAFYGALPAPPALPFALYVWEVLSLGATPSRRDAAFNALKRIPALTADAMARVPQAKLEAAVALAGPMKDERVRALRAGADLFRRTPSLLDDLSGPFSRALRAARRIPYLGRASALRFLLFGGGHAVLPLDEHALRVARRLGYPKGILDEAGTLATLRKARQSLTRESDRSAESLRLLSQYFTHHGLSTCTEASPHCSICPLAFDCEWIRRQ